MLRGFANSWQVTVLSGTCPLRMIVKQLSEHGVLVDEPR